MPGGEFGIATLASLVFDGLCSSPENEHVNDETKRLLCRMVAGLVASDEDFTDGERAFVEKVLAQFGIPESEWEAIYPLVDPEDARAEIANLNGAARTMAIDLLVQAAAADGKIVAEEVRYLNAVAEAMKVHPSVVETRLRKAIDEMPQTDET